MARKTIYVKPEKEEMYDKAVKLSKENSLSAVIEEAIEKIVEEKGKYLRYALLIKVTERINSPMLLTELASISKEVVPKELLDEADLILDVMKFNDYYDEEEDQGKGYWKGEKSGSNICLRQRGFEDDLSWLDEMYELALKPEFKRLKSKYKDKILNDIEELDLDEETKKQIIKNIKD